MFLRTRSRKILRDIWSRKARTFLVSINIFIGVLGVVTLTSLSDIMISRLKTDLPEDKLGMVFAWVGLPEGATPDNAQVIETLRQYPGLTALEMRYSQPLYWRFADEDSFILGNIRAFSVPFDQQQIEPVTLKEGAFPQMGQKQFVVEYRMAKRYHLEVGDQIVIRNLQNLAALRENPTLPIPEETWTISGIVMHPYVGAGDTSLYTNYEDLLTVAPSGEVNTITARFTDFATAEQAYQPFLQTIRDQTPYTVEDDYLQNPADSEFINEMQQWAKTLMILALVAMIVSGFLVFTVISTIVVEQRQQIGIMKAIGATRPDHVTIYSGIAVVYGILGTIFGVILGIPAGFYLTRAMAPLIYLVIEDFTISPLAIVAGTVMGLATPVLASMIPVYMGTRVSILSAITDLGISSRYGQGLIAHAIGRLPFPIVVRQALANIYQKRGRLALTGLTLTMAVGAFMGVSAVFISLNNVLGDIFSTFNFELVVFPEKTEDMARVQALLSENIEQIDHIYPIQLDNAEVISQKSGEREQIRVTAFQPDTGAIVFNLKEGRGDLDENSVVITQKTVDITGKTIGDTLTLYYEDREIPLTIIGIDNYPFERAFVRLDVLTDTPSGLVLQLDNRDVTAAEVEELMGDIRELLLRNGIQTGFYNQIEDKEVNAATIQQVGLLFNIVSIVMALVGALGLLTMLSISVFERQREIGVMRSVGATSSVIASQFLIEGLTVGMIAWLIGIPLSYGLSLVLMEFLPLDEFGFRYPIMITLAGLIGMVVVATTASLWPSLSAARKTVSEILRYQ